MRLLSLTALVALACELPPAEPPEPPPDGPGECADACENLARLGGCGVAADTCEKACDGASSAEERIDMEFPSGCLAAADSCEQAHQCR